MSPKFLHRANPVGTFVTKFPTLIVPTGTFVTKFPIFDSSHRYNKKFATYLQYSGSYF